MMNILQYLGKLLVLDYISIHVEYSAYCVIRRTSWILGDLQGIATPVCYNC